MATPLSNKVTDLDNSTVIARGGKAVQAGTGAQTAAYTGELGEITYDTTDNRLVAHDGATAGGHPVATESEADTVGFQQTNTALTATVATLGVPVKLVGTTAERGPADSNGFTVGTDNTVTATFAGTKLCRFHLIASLDVAAGTDSITIHIFKNGSSVFEASAQSVTALTPKLFEIDVLLNVANGDVFELYAENEDTTENVIMATSSQRADTVPQQGFLTVTG